MVYSCGSSYSFIVVMGSSESIISKLDLASFYFNVHTGIWFHNDKPEFFPCETIRHMETVYRSSRFCKTVFVILFDSHRLRNFLRQPLCQFNLRNLFISFRLKTLEGWEFLNHRQWYFRVCHFACKSTKFFPSTNDASNLDYIQIYKWT